MNDEYIEEETTTEESTNSTQGLTYDDVYNATYNAIMDADAELKIQEAEALSEQELEEDAEEEETTEETVYNVNCVNLPSVQGVNVRNYEDFPIASITDAIMDSYTETGVVEFNSATDATLYTVGTSSAIGSANAQEVALLLECRNIMLIFMLFWLVTYLIRIIKNTTMKFTKGKGESV